MSCPVLSRHKTRQDKTRSRRHHQTDVHFGPSTSLSLGISVSPMEDPCGVDLGHSSLAPNEVFSFLLLSVRTAVRLSCHESSEFPLNPSCCLSSLFSIYLSLYLYLCWGYNMRCASCTALWTRPGWLILWARNDGRSDVRELRSYGREGSLLCQAQGSQYGQPYCEALRVRGMRDSTELQLRRAEESKVCLVPHASFFMLHSVRSGKGPRSKEQG